MSKVDLIVVGVSGLVISVSPGKRVGDVTGRRDNEIFARGTRRLAVSAIIQNVFFEWPPDRGNIICAEGAIMGPIIRARGDCSQPHFNPWPRSSESAAGARRRPISGWPTYPANLCLVLRDGEFAGKREDFGKPIGKAIQRASLGALGQSAAEHFHDMLRGAKRVKDSVEIGAGREGVSFGRWRKVPGARAGRFELALHIGRNNV